MSNGMPFDRYFKDVEPAAGEASSSRNAQTEHDKGFDASARPTSSMGDLLGMGPSTFSNGIQFQMPSYLLPPGDPSMVPVAYHHELFPSAGHSYYSAPTWEHSSVEKENPFNTKVKYYTLDASPHESFSSKSAGKQRSLPFNYDDTPVVRDEDDFSSPVTVQDHGMQHSDAHELPHPVSEIRKSMLDPVNLPVYSQSGFDMLSILGRVACRPNPAIKLGPVDMSCAFVVADVRLVDSPIIYASRTFLDLTGYSEEEVLGRNCRFLQAPDGRVRKGDQRKCTSSEAVSDMKYSTAVDRECQVSLINYRKDGTPFVNRVSIVPVPAVEGSDEIAYHVGFQIDLNEQPSYIVQRLRDGSYYTKESDVGLTKAALSAGEKCAKAMSKELRGILFQSSFFTTTAANAISDKPDKRDAHQWLDLVFLENTPDFIHVLSLKGHFLYVSPSVRLTLGYEPHELLGSSITDFCHPSDVVPLLRELKGTHANNAPATPATPTAPFTKDGPDTTDAEQPLEPQAAQMKTIDILFRMRSKSGSHVWVECIGRQHVEPGKNRKAIVLSGRVCQMPSLRWDDIAQAGGLTPPILRVDQQPGLQSADGAIGLAPVEYKQAEQEFWTILSSEGVFLVASTGVRDLLGWGPGEVIGRSLKDIVSDSDGEEYLLQRLLEALKYDPSAEKMSVQRTVPCDVKTRDGGVIGMQAVLYYSPPNAALYDQPFSSSSVDRVIVQFKTRSPGESRSAPGRVLHDLQLNVFEELETTRGTSWQYEIQQQKFANRKLMDEVHEMEKQLNS